MNIEVISNYKIIKNINQIKDNKITITIPKELLTEEHKINIYHIDKNTSTKLKSITINKESEIYDFEFKERINKGYLLIDICEDDNSIHKIILKRSKRNTVLGLLALLITIAILIDSYILNQENIELPDETGYELPDLEGMGEIGDKDIISTEDLKEIANQSVEYNKIEIYNAFILENPDAEIDFALTNKNEDNKIQLLVYLRDDFDGYVEENFSSKGLPINYMQAFSELKEKTLYISPEIDPMKTLKSGKLLKTLEPGEYDISCYILYHSDTMTGISRVLNKLYINE